MINKQFKSSENSSGTALNYNEEAPEMLWSSKTEDGYLGKCRKHCTYVSLPPSPEQLSAKKGFLGIISLHREKRKSLASLIHRRCLQPLLWGPPQSSPILNLVDRDSQNSLCRILSPRLQLKYTEYWTLAVSPQSLPRIFETVFYLYFTDDIEACKSQGHTVRK